MSIRLTPSNQSPINAFFIALQFLTILPTPQHLNRAPQQLSKSVLYYPFIGLLIGSLLYACMMLTNFSSPPIQSTLILCLWVVITGALHLDGLADCADAWVGGHGDHARSLQIMKDPAAGPVAVVGLILVLMLKWVLISAIINQQLTEFLLFTPVLGRMAVLILMQSSNYIRTNGLATQITQNLPHKGISLLSIFVILMTLFVLGFIPIIMMIMTTYCIHKQAIKRFGGTTGDVYGATVELVEVSVLLGTLFI